jgi:hypothetical protein
MLTEAVWREKSKTLVHVLPPAGEVALWGCSRQIRTLPSYEEEARIVPNLGCAYGAIATVSQIASYNTIDFVLFQLTHATHHTAPSWLYESNPD